MKDNYIVYCHELFDGRKYIGITCQKPNRRFRNGDGYKGCKHFYRAIQKYGWGSFEHKIVYSNLSKEEACNKEIELIKKYKTNNDKYGFNISIGGDSGSNGVKMSEEQRQALIKRLTGRIVSKETREKISKAKKGKKLSQKQIEQLRQKAIGNSYHKGYKVSEEGRRKMSEAKKGKPPWNKGKKCPSISFSKMGSKNPMYKPSLHIESEGLCNA